MPTTMAARVRINPPPRTVETSSGLLNSIGLDNDGLEQFIEKHLEYLLSLNTSVIANIAGHNVDDFVQMAARLNEFPQGKNTVSRKDNSGRKVSSGQSANDRTRTFQAD